MKFDSNLTIVAIDDAIAAHAKGIVVVVPEQKIGPAVLKKAKDAGIPIIAVDDGIKDEAGNDAPFVGFSGVAIGKKVRRRGSRTCTERNFRLEKAWA